jgi:hypothetical protein
MLLVFTMILSCAPRQVINPCDRIVVCERPSEPVYSVIPDDANENQVIEIMLLNLNEMIDYTLKLGSTLKCFEDSLK